jgi:hypothetical protein
LDTAEKIVQVPMGFLENAVRYIGLNSALIKRAMADRATLMTGQKQAMDVRDVVLSALVEKRAVAKDRQEECRVMLGSHAETLKLLKAAADKIGELSSECERLRGMPKHSQANGDAVDAAAAGVSGHTKKGEYNSLEDPVAGRRTSQIKESDKALLALIGK